MHKWKDNKAEFLFGHEMNMCNEFQWQSQLPWEWGGPTVKHKVLDRVERIDSTRLIIDRLDFSRFCWSTRLGWKSIDSFPTVYKPIHFLLRNFSWAACFSSSCLSVCHNHGLCSWLLDNSQTCRLERSPDLCAKTTGRIELQLGVLIGLGQCHFVLDGCPIPNRPSVTFPGEGHS